MKGEVFKDLQEQVVPVQDDIYLMFGPPKTFADTSWDREGMAAELGQDKVD
jgi:hypothetical protein